MSDDLKKRAAEAALVEVVDGMKLGIGTGSTANFFIDALGKRVSSGLSIIGVPTSEATRLRCEKLGIPLTTLDDEPTLDLTIDGADELDSELRLIKGGGGALLREKIVAHASRRMVVIADDSKLVERLGAFPLPIEINPFGMAATVQAIRAIAGAGTELTLRKGEDGLPYQTDGGHFIIDASFGRIADPSALSFALNAIPGVVEHGLFMDLADRAYVASSDGVERLEIERVKP